MSEYKVSQSYSQQQFIQNGERIEMQIVGDKPEVSVHEPTQLKFKGVSHLLVTLYPNNGAEATTIVWDASACMQTQAGNSRLSQPEEREKIIHLLKQFPATPVPPSF